MNIVKKSNFFKKDKTVVRSNHLPLDMIHTNRMLFTIRSINSSFMHYFKLQKFEFLQLIDDMTINL